MFRTFLSFVAASMLLAALPASACDGTFDPDGLGPLRCILCDDDSSSSAILLAIDGLATHGDAAGNSCGAAIGPLDTGTITAIDVVDRKGKPISGFQFDASAATAESLSCLVGPGAQGFSGELTAPVPHGVPNSLLISVKLGRGETVDDVLDAFEGAIIALGSTDRGGEFDGKHLYTQALKVERPKSALD